MDGDDDRRSLLQLNSDNKLSAATGGPPRHQHPRPTAPTPRDRHSHRKRARILHTTTLHHPPPLPVKNRKNGSAAERPRRMAAPARVVARRQSTPTNNTFPGSDLWGIQTNNHLSRWEYMEDALAAERRFKRVAGRR